MISATIFNYFGPIAYSGLSLFYSFVAIVMIYSAVSTFTKDGSSRRLVSALVLGALYTTLIFARFPGKDEFGVFTATGIRFGLYWLHPTITISLFIFIINKLMEREKLDLKYYLLFLLVPNIVSVWSISAWIVLLLVSSIYFTFLKKSKEIGLTLFKGLSISLLSSVPLSLQILEPTVRAGRFAGEIQDLSWSLELKNYVFNLPSTYFNFWSLQSLTPILLGALLGLAFQPSTIQKSKLRHSPKRDELLHSVGVLLMANVLITPIYFNLLEAFSYRAYWHLTTPNTFFFFSSLVFAASCLQRQQKSKKRAVIKKFAIFTLTFLAFSNSNNFQNSLKTVYNFKNSWDAGNVLGIGFPIENKSTYNVQEILKISPYNFPHVDLKKLMIDTITFTTSVNETRNSMFVSVQVSDSVFIEELDGEANIDVVFSTANGGGEPAFLVNLINSEIYPIKFDSSGMAMANVRVKIGEVSSFRIAEGG
jgi:hypothetical protein